MLEIKALYPVVNTREVAEAARFFREWFGFELAFESDWFVHLVRRQGERVEQLAFVAYDHETVPASGRAPAAGVLLSFEVADATAAWRALRDAAPVLLPLRDEPFGQRHFILAGPEGTMVDVIEMIPPTPEHAAQYTSATV